MAYAEHMRTPLYRDERFLRIANQVVVVALVAGILLFLYSNMVTALRTQKEVPISYDFLQDTAGFNLGESTIAFTRTDPIHRAMLVGLLNTFKVSIAGIALATILGTFIGVMRLSSNFLVSKIALVYINVFRNIPPLLLLIFWYRAIFLKLPRVQEAIVLFDPVFPVYIANRGLFFPWGTPTESWYSYRWILLGGFALALFVAYRLRQHGKRTGRMPLVTLWFVVILLSVTVIGYVILPDPLEIVKPALKGFNIRGGGSVSLEFWGLLFGLVIYAAAYIAEAVRAGILSVDRGQREAARALGFSSFNIMRLIILPQAIRVVVPPLISYAIGFTKNTSLGLAIGYTDFFAITGGLILNNTGRAVETLTIILLVYLTISLIASLILNMYNRKITLSH